MTVAIIQARMGSTRLPEKVLKDIDGATMVARVVERTRLATTVDTVIVATSREPQDDAIAEFCAEHDIKHFRGSETDVLDRYQQAATEYDADTVVRVTSDCPLIAPETIDRAVRLFDAGAGDYVTNTLYYTYPDGLDVEVFSRETLAEAHENATSEKAREHVTPYMRNPDNVEVYNFENPIDVWGYEYTTEDVIPRWTVDYPADLEFVRAVHEGLRTEYGKHVTQQAVHELVERKPDLRDINDDRTRENYHLETMADRSSDR